VGNPNGRHETPAERLDRNWDELLQELRVTQTGVQLLTAFLLSLPLQQRFDGLLTYQRGIYLVCVGLSVAATGFLVAPVAVHRALFRHHEKDRLVAIGDQAARVGLALLALAVSAVVALIFSIVVGKVAAAVASAAALFLLAVLWWWLPVTVLRRHTMPGDSERQ
jgi:predicted neutral ceramidase superfamily lipid hydrolase